MQQKDLKGKVVVTGSAGFLGHHLVKELKKRGYYIIGIDNLTTGDEQFKNLADEFHFKDIRDIKKNDVLGAKYIFHTAAQPSIPVAIKYPVLTNDINVNGTLAVLVAARNAGVEKVIYSSSSSVYGGQTVYPTREDAQPIPLSPYAVQKLAAELYCEAFNTTYGLPTVSMRYFNVFGEEQKASNPYSGVVTKFLEMRRAKKPLTIYGDGEQRRDFTYVGDVVNANIFLAENAMGVFNVGTGKNFSINEIANAIGGEKQYLHARTADPRLSLAENTKLTSLGWKPTTDILTWLKN